MSPDNQVPIRALLPDGFAGNMVSAWICAIASRELQSMRTLGVNDYDMAYVDWQGAAASLYPRLAKRFPHLGAGDEAVVR